MRSKILPPNVFFHVFLNVLIAEILIEAGMDMGLYNRQQFINIQYYWAIIWHYFVDNGEWHISLYPLVDTLNLEEDFHFEWNYAYK